MNNAIARLIPVACRESWQWWEARRLRYNVGLVVAGWCAWALFWIVQFVFDSVIPTGWQFLQITLMLGLGYVVAMVFANILFLSGVLAEAVIKPVDTEGFRERMWTLGYGASTALPFLLPMGTLVILLAADRSY